MSTLSVPMPPDLLKAIEDLISKGIASSKADAVRKAVEKYVEQMAVEEILSGSREPSLEGDLDDLLQKI